MGLTFYLRIPYFSDNKMDQTNQGQEEENSNQQELDDSTKVNGRMKTFIQYYLLNTRCWRDPLPPLTWHVVCALLLLQITCILEVRLHFLGFINRLSLPAHTCYSCRAFFRRTAQRKAAKGLKRCRTGLKNCEVSDQKKNCIHCRYIKCIKIGMTSDLMQVQKKRCYD
jgi:hypothetical protein